MANEITKVGATRIKVPAFESICSRLLFFSLSVSRSSSRSAPERHLLHHAGSSGGNVPRPASANALSDRAVDNFEGGTMIIAPNAREQSIMGSVEKSGGRGGANPGDQASHFAGSSMTYSDAPPLFWTKLQQESMVSGKPLAERLAGSASLALAVKNAAGNHFFGERLRRYLNSGGGTSGGGASSLSLHASDARRRSFDGSAAGALLRAIDAPLVEIGGALRPDAAAGSAGQAKSSAGRGRKRHSHAARRHSFAGVQAGQLLGCAQAADRGSLGGLAGSSQLAWACDGAQHPAVEGEGGSATMQARRESFGGASVAALLGGAAPAAERPASAGGGEGHDDDSADDEPSRFPKHRDSVEMRRPRFPQAGAAARRASFSGASMAALMSIGDPATASADAQATLAKETGTSQGKGQRKARASLSSLSGSGARISSPAASLSAPFATDTPANTEAAPGPKVQYKGRKSAMAARRASFAGLQAAALLASSETGQAAAGDAAAAAEAASVDMTAEQRRRSSLRRLTEFRAPGVSASQALALRLADDQRLAGRGGGGGGGGSLKRRGIGTSKSRATTYDMIGSANQTGSESATWSSSRMSGILFNR